MRAGESASTPAVFQADFLFLQRAGCDLELHRVAHGFIITDACAPEVKFSPVEYVHTPQEGVPGFRGTFSMKPNPSYKENDPRGGPMFVRHHNIGRDS
eukprot:4688281-Pleurochrysis_carterae.AAC.1